MYMDATKCCDHGIKLLIGLVTALLLSGCSLWGSGSDSSEAQVTNWQRCKFDLKQAARVAGADDTDVIENVTVTPDCDVRIEFRQISGDSVLDIESRGGMEVLEHMEHTEQPAPEQTEEPQDDNP
jgi:hypothetical protein